MKDTNPGSEIFEVEDQVKDKLKNKMRTDTLVYSTL